MAGNSKQSKKRERGRTVDRLSGLPDDVLDHIISFLDTKSAVRTSLLARRWRCLWKHAPVLNFLWKSFPTKSSFTKHVNRILSLRFHGIPVSSITFNICGEKWRGAVKTFRKIVKYAGSHDGGGLRHLSFISDKQTSIRDVASVISASCHHESLNTLKFEGCALERHKFGLGFKLLTSLELRKCILLADHAEERFDPFANLPCLNYLKLLYCQVVYRQGSRFIISGLQLLDLELQLLGPVNEVLAPKLKSLHWRGTHPHQYLLKLNLPALDHANISLGWCIRKSDAAMEEENRAIMNFLCGLQNVECLEIYFDMDNFYHEEHQFPLHRIKALIGPEAPPFTRLKTLRIQYAGEQKMPNIHYEVIRYFFEGSLSTEEKFFQVELVNEEQC